MSRVFEIDTKPYEDFKLYNRKQVEIKPGITMLVGCNGSGKTTLIDYMKDSLEADNIPYISFNNIVDVRESKSNALYHDNMALLAVLATSSEGECITLNLIELTKTIAKYIKTGDNSNNLNKLLNLLSERETVETDERWIFFDGVDSGMSIDAIIDFKECLMEEVLNHFQDKEIYFVVSANTYEMVNGEQCLDVFNGNYVTFQDYEKYREFVLKTRGRKDKRYKQS